MFPNFIIAGVSKAGTTSLWHYLSTHPKVFMPDKNGVNFFSSDANFSLGIDWYKAQFRNPGAGGLIGESSPVYSLYSYVPERIYRFNNTVKLIFVVRNPVDRAYSHYWHSVRDGYESLSFENAIAIEDERIHVSDHHMRAFSYLSRGFYCNQINNFLQYFPSDQILTVIFEDMVQDKSSSLGEVYEFLGLDCCSEKSLDAFNSSKIIRSKTLHRVLLRDSVFKDCFKLVVPDNVRKFFRCQLESLAVKDGHYPEMEPGTRAYLLEFFSEENEKLSHLLGKSLSEWSY